MCIYVMERPLTSAVVFTLASTLLVGLRTPALAEFNGQPCQCRSKEGKVDEGTVMCITTPSGEKLMRCEMVLNNSAWVPIANGCAVGNLDAPNYSPAGNDLLRVRLGLS
ncbi:MAG: hypothetical protein AAGH82_09215 [Pseudomonadota bacterium]